MAYAIIATDLVKIDQLPEEVFVKPKTNWLTKFFVGKKLELIKYELEINNFYEFLNRILNIEDSRKIGKHLTNIGQEVVEEFDNIFDASNSIKNSTYESTFTYETFSGGTITVTLITTYTITPIN